jgi:hypothetical protein
MSMKRDTSNDRAPGAASADMSIGHNNARDFSAQYGIIITVEGMNPDSLERTHNMTTIFLASDSTDDTPIAFSNIGTALEYVRDSHGDLNPEDSALMLQSGAGLVPATNKAVKAARGVLRFEAAGADAASQVSAAQSKLDGALQACALVGVDPANVATVANLQHALLAAQALVGTDDAAASFVIRPVTLHKRGYKNS